MKKLYYLGAVFVLLLICGMSYVSLQQKSAPATQKQVYPLWIHLLLFLSV